MAKILVIEDDRELVKLIAKRLETAGYQPLSAFDGEDGLFKAQKELPNLVILDLKLPKLDGYRVCELLKADDKTKNIPILILSGRKEEIEKKAGFAAGADDYLVKPYDSELLLEKIKTLIR